ncbi:hypothetical protein DB345_09600 [Spartobacteria bacterium LR76]|nr:hypothetical protein DB345_09600 [Spartobacteria bacterium LR76]
MNTEKSSLPSPVNYRRIAEACGVGKTTVGRVLQGTGYVAEKTREKVLQAANSLGYRPDPSLGALTRRRWPLGAKPQTATLAWIHQPLIPPSNHPAPEFVGAQQRAAELGYQLDEFSLGDYPTAAALGHVIYHRGIRGVLIQAFRDGINLELDWEHFFTIFVGPENDLARVHTVQADFRSAMHQGVQACVSRGYRRIGIALMNYRASGTDVPFHAQALFEIDRLGRTLGAQPAIHHYEPSDDSVRDFATWVRRERPDVVISTNVQPYYWLTGGDYFDRRLRSWRIPEELGFLCLRDITELPDCSQISLRPVEQGRQAVDLAHQQLQHGIVGRPEIPLRLLVPPVLIPGATLRKLRIAT